MRKRYNTPHRSRVVKTRMTEEEYAEFAERLSAYNMSQAEFIRQGKYDKEEMLSDVREAMFSQLGADVSCEELNHFFTGKGKACLLYTSRCV